MAELPVSLIQVTDITRVTPHMARVTFDADQLDASVGRTPDQQVKLCFPLPGQRVPILPEEGGDATSWYYAFLAIPEDERPTMRSFTVRRRVPGTNTIEIDFVLHGETGPATRWAASAQPGDQLGMVGPSAVYALPVSIDDSIANSDWLLLIGDETALPAIGTLLEALPEGARAHAYIEVADHTERQSFETNGDVSVNWVFRNGTAAGQSDVLFDTVGKAEFAPGRPFVWLAGESGTVRALRRHLVDDRGLDKRSIAFSGYWRFKLTQDDAPTEQDMAEAQERLAEATAE
ncbi:siderophore-interacting protein [Streptomyces sp. So13.3]|uniref:siderophore-interacting protein n=1 Tax=Streptomyces TaxID=1883 RepID=UPI00110686E5|nr:MULTISPECIES: siderophore-interacting protein [Streptomyces]MCZ4099664.1 siderophore-interacting protein [Streptomyces sp. H39-C1]QNA70922.1 siderophore-interacting protein [Streptomyces sp. So13.3]